MKQVDDLLVNKCFDTTNTSSSLLFLFERRLEERRERSVDMVQAAELCSLALK